MKEWNHQKILNGYSQGMPMETFHFIYFERSTIFLDPHCWKVRMYCVKEACSPSLYLPLQVWDLIVLLARGRDKLNITFLHHVNASALWLVYLFWSSRAWKRERKWKMKCVLTDSFYFNKRHKSRSADLFFFFQKRLFFFKEHVQEAQFSIFHHAVPVCCCRGDALRRVDGPGHSVLWFIHGWCSHFWWRLFKCVMGHHRRRNQCEFIPRLTW